MEGPSRLSREEWHDVPGYEGRYMVNLRGEILSLKILKPQSGNGHVSPRVQLRDGNGRLRQFMVSAIVEKVFGGTADKN